MTLDKRLPKTILKKAMDYNNKFPNRLNSIDDEREYKGNAPYWFYTETGWCFDEGRHTETAYSVKEAIDVFRSIEPCHCSECERNKN